MDVCKNCELRGDFKQCKDTECAYHNAWMVQTLQQKFLDVWSSNEINRMILEAIEKILIGDELTEFEKGFQVVRQVYDAIHRK